MSIQTALWSVVLSVWRTCFWAFVEVSCGWRYFDKCRHVRLKIFFQMKGEMIDRHNGDCQLPFVSGLNVLLSQQHSHNMPGQPSTVSSRGRTSCESATTSLTALNIELKQCGKTTAALTKRDKCIQVVDFLSGSSSPSTWHNCKCIHKQVCQAAS